MQKGGDTDETKHPTPETKPAPDVLWPDPYGDYASVRGARRPINFPELSDVWKNARRANSGHRIRPALTLDRVAENTPLDVGKILDLFGSVSEDSVSGIVSEGISELNRRLSHAVRRKKYEIRNIPILRFKRHIDDQTTIGNRWVRLPFLEERMMENPDNENLHARKEPKLEREIRVVERNEDVEVAPDPVIFWMYLDPGMAMNVGSDDGFSQHLRMFFTFLSTSAKALKEEIQVRLLVSEWEDPTGYENFVRRFEQCRKGFKLDVEFFGKGDSVPFLATFMLNKNSSDDWGFRLFQDESTRKDQRHRIPDGQPSVHEQILRLDLSERLTYSKAKIIEFLLDSLKTHYEL